MRARRAFLVFPLSFLLCAASPQDPHVPDCWGSNSCPWFEGWYTRVIDPVSRNSFAVIVATLNSTGESMVTILACYRKKSDGVSVRSQEAVDGGHGIISGATGALWQTVNGDICDRTDVADVISKGGSVLSHGEVISRNPDLKSAPDFEWSLPGFGSIKVNATLTRVDMTVGKVSFKASLTEQKSWRKGDPSASPEGWAGKKVPWMLPCRWYIYSLGSKAEYEFKNGSQQLAGSGWGHEEKNWGKMFPEGHVWVQAISPDNSVQIVLVIVYFKVLGVTTPRLVTVGFRSAKKGKVNLINTSLFSYVTELDVDPCAGKVHVLIHDVRHTIRIDVSADPRSFGNINGPTPSGRWDKVCAESFSAVVQVGLWRRTDSWLKRISDWFIHGLLGESHLVERVDFHGAALEFGEGLLYREDVASHEQVIKKDSKSEGKYAEL